MERYNPQINIPEIGIAGQKLIANAKVLVIGAGGLGCPVLIYLAGSGVGEIGIVEDDKIELSNINRQILFHEKDAGRNKTEIAKARLSEINSGIRISVFNDRLTESNSKTIIQKFDLVVDCSDNIETRRILDDACSELNKPWIYAAVSGFEGQVSVFNYKNGFRYNDLYPEDRTTSPLQGCVEEGILGSTCAYASSVQVTEAIKIILGMESVLDGRILTFNLINYKNRLFSFKKSLL